MQRVLSSTIAVLLFIVTLTVFWGVVGAEFVRWDDPAAITENPGLGPLSWERIRWAFTDVTSTQRYLPLSLLSWVMTYQVCQFHPLGYHLGNLLLHAGSVVLLFASLVQLDRWIGRRDPTPATELPQSAGRSLRRLIPAAVGALFWGLHPLRTEPVAWCTARPYDLATFFALLSLWCYLRLPLDSARSAWKSGWYMGSVMAFIAAVLSHPMCVGFPIAFVLLDWAAMHGQDLSTQARRRYLWTRLFQKTPYALAAGAIAAITIAARSHSTIYIEAASLADFSMGQRVVQAVYLWSYYAWRPLWPVHLSPVYTTLLQVQGLEWRFLLSNGIVVLISSTLVILRHRFPLLLGLWVFHLVVLIPVLGWSEHPHYSTDRYSLLASLSLSVLVAAGLTRLLSAARSRWVGFMGVAAAVLMLIGLSALSVQQASHWKNSMALFEYVISELGDHPYRADLLVRLGPLRDELGDERGAILALQEALEIEPDNIVALDSLACVHWRHQRAGDAVIYWERLLALQPDLEPVRCNMALALSSSNNTQRGIQLLMDGLHTGASALDTRYTLGVLLAKSGKIALAIEQFEHVLEIEPDHAEAAKALRNARQRLPAEQPHR